MSSEILRGGSGQVHPFPWRRVPGGFEPERWHSAQSASREEFSSGAAEIEAVKKQVEQGRQEGKRDGEAQAAKASGDRLDAVFLKLNRSIEELAGLRPRFRAEAEHDVVKLAMAIAKRIVNSELNVDPDIILALVKAGIQKLDARDISIVRSHPEDAPRIKLFFENSSHPGRIQVDADSSLERGAIVFTTSRGSLDVSVNTQLGEIERGFTDLMRRQS